MNEKMPNKYNVPEAQSYTFDSEKNDWLEQPHNFYFFEGEDAKVIYHYYIDENNDKKEDSNS
tara:strand:+ start:1774 stop:1959 length:186 start_codon:yes stop_codon:yes gene_type:complete